MKIYFVKLAVFAALSLSTSLLSAQVFSYDFETQNASNPFADTGWGAGWSNNEQSLTSGGNPNFNQFLGHGIFTNASNEQVQGTIVGLNGHNFQATSVHTASSYDLSTLGSSVTIHQWWGPTNFQTNRPDTATTGVNELVQIGLISNTSANFRDASNNSLYVGGLEESYDRLNNLRTLSHSVYDQAGNSTSAIAGSGFDTWGLSKSTAFEYSITFSNSGVNTFDISVDIDKWGETSAFGPYSELDANFLNASVSGVTHSFSASELASLRVGLGLRITDNSKVSGTGTNYDALNTVFTPVPEPSTSTFAALILSIGLFRRPRS